MGMEVDGSSEGFEVPGFTSLLLQKRRTTFSMQLIAIKCHNESWTQQSHSAVVSGLGIKPWDTICLTSNSGFLSCSFGFFFLKLQDKFENGKPRSEGTSCPTK